LDASDANHARAASTMRTHAGSESLLTHNYIVVEASALVHRRLGPGATRALLNDVLPAFEIEWVSQEVHRVATAAFLAAARRRTSFVDWVSFEVMRTRAILRAFAFDRDFAAAGFELL
jgi:uncharacterized protein